MFSKWWSTLRNLNLSIVRNYPKSTVMTGMLLTSPFVNILLKKRARKRLILPLDRALEEGRTPSEIQSTMIPRTELIKTVQTLFIPAMTDNSHGYFGMILGPSGAGKTTLIGTSLFEKSKRKGAVYVEITEPKLVAQELASAIGMRVGPSNIKDIILGYLSTGYKDYYELPSDQLRATKVVIDTFEEAAIRYKCRHNNIPCVFIDVIDLLAKANPEAFLHLIMYAKVLLADNLTARVAFVGREGSVIPIVDTTSAMNRATSVIEVGDIMDEEAINFLIKKGISEDNAQQLVKFFGGRFAYLNECVELHDHFRKQGAPVDIQVIKSNITEEKINNQRRVIKANDDAPGIIQQVLKHGTVLPSDLIEKPEKAEAILKCIKDLIDANVLRYDNKRRITFHSRV